LLVLVVVECTTRIIDLDDGGYHLPLNTIHCGIVDERSHIHDDDDDDDDDDDKEEIFSSGC
jgi:hypothetical protein